MADSPFSDNKIPESAQASATNLKLPPHSIDAEQSVLGALMLDNTAWHDVAEIVIAEDFLPQGTPPYFPGHAAPGHSGQPNRLGDAF